MSILSIAKSAYKALPSIKTVKRAVKTVPSILFEDGADVLVRGARDSFKAGIKNNLSIKKSLLKGLKEGGGNLALNVAKKTRTSGSVFSRIFSSIKSTPKDLIAATKGGAAAAKAAGKSGILGGLKGLGKGFWSKMPLIGNLMLIGFELPNIFKATKEQGVGQGVAEVAKAGVRLTGASIGAAVGSMAFGPIGGFIGWGLGEWLTSKVIGKSYSEKVAEAEEKQAEAMALLQQQPQVAQTYPQYNPIAFSGAGNMDNFLANSMANPYSNDLMMQNMNFNTIA